METRDLRQLFLRPLPHLPEKLDEHRPADGHRRISKSAVMQYRTGSKLLQSTGLEAMVSASERLGLYGQELAGIPIRAK